MFFDIYIYKSLGIIVKLNYNYLKFNMYGFWVGFYILSDMENQVIQSCLFLFFIFVFKVSYGLQFDGFIFVGVDKGVFVVQSNQSANVVGVFFERLQFDLFEVKYGVSFIQFYIGENRLIIQ